MTRRQKYDQETKMRSCWEKCLLLLHSGSSSGHKFGRRVEGAGTPGLVPALSTLGGCCPPCSGRPASDLHIYSIQAGTEHLGMLVSLGCYLHCPTPYKSNSSLPGDVEWARWPLDPEHNQQQSIWEEVSLYTMQQPH